MAGETSVLNTIARLASPQECLENALITADPLCNMESTLKAKPFL